MPYIQRADGEHFVIPSYRDVLNVKGHTQLKREILALSQSHGELITLQKKSASQYEVAFSSDNGYLLGESVWHHFKRPLDMIYCEALPNSNEAILVIVKTGSVYLDGSFHLENIPEELIVFLTQQNNFEIYTYGDVPISQLPEEGKFSFEAIAVKSFTKLDEPVFPRLPKLKIYQLQLVDTILKSQGIGVFPTRQVATGAIAVIITILAFLYYKSLTPPPPPPVVVDPYTQYMNALASPEPVIAINKLIDVLNILYLMPGWHAQSFVYTNGLFEAQVQSDGGKLQALQDWCNKNNFNFSLQKNGINLSRDISQTSRSTPHAIYKIDNVVALLADRMALVYPGNNLTLGDFTTQGNYTELPISINLVNISPIMLSIIAKEFEDLPLVLKGINAQIGANHQLTGSILLIALGN